MAKVDILYHCGCGWRTRDQSLAEQHCDESFHDLSVTGVIRSSTRPADWGRVPHQQKRLREIGTPVSALKSTPRPAGPMPQTPAVDTSSFDRLRDMIKGPK